MKEQIQEYSHQKCKQSKGYEEYNSYNQLKGYKDGINWAKKVIVGKGSVSWREDIDKLVKGWDEGISSIVSRGGKVLSRLESCVVEQGDNFIVIFMGIYEPAKEQKVDGVIHER